MTSYYKILENIILIAITNNVIFLQKKRLVKMIKIKFHSIIAVLPYLLVDIASASPEFFQFTNYGLSPTLNTSVNCTLETKACINLCISKSNCTAIALEGTEARCDTIKMIYYGRVILQSKSFSSVWIKSEFLFLLHFILPHIIF